MERYLVNWDAHLLSSTCLRNSIIVWKQVLYWDNHCQWYKAGWHFCNHPVFYLFRCHVFIYFSKCSIGIGILFKTTGRVSNLRRFNVRSKTFQTLVHKLLYANDADLVAHTKRNLQMLVDRFSTVPTVFGFIISLKKQKWFLLLHLVCHTVNLIFTSVTLDWLLWVLLCILAVPCHGMNHSILKYIFTSRRILLLLAGWRSGHGPTGGVTFQTKVTAYQTCVLS